MVLKEEPFIFQYYFVFNFLGSSHCFYVSYGDIFTILFLKNFSVDLAQEANSLHMESGDREKRLFWALQAFLALKFVLLKLLLFVLL